jgi:hypothetical protein
MDLKVEEHNIASEKVVLRVANFQMLQQRYSSFVDLCPLKPILRRALNYFSCHLLIHYYAMSLFSLRILINFSQFQISLGSAAAGVRATASLIAPTGLGVEPSA